MTLKILRCDERDMRLVIKDAERLICGESTLFGVLFHQHDNSC